MVHNVQRFSDLTTSSKHFDLRVATMVSITSCQNTSDYAFTQVQRKKNVFIYAVLTFCASDLMMLNLFAHLESDKISLVRN